MLVEFNWGVLLCCDDFIGIGTVVKGITRLLCCMADLCVFHGERSQTAFIYEGYCYPMNLSTID
jgi:hypothetical protein